jgi:hypothetical protein
MQQELTQGRAIAHDRHRNRSDEMANLSSYLSAMAIAVGLIIAWAGFCAF